MVIRVGSTVTWRHGSSKARKEKAKRTGVANCTVVELAEAGDGRARIRLPPTFNGQEVRVLLADLEATE